MMEQDGASLDLEVLRVAPAAVADDDLFSEQTITQRAEREYAVLADMRVSFRRVNG